MPLGTHPRDVSLDGHSAALVWLARSAHDAALLDRTVTSRLLGLARAVRGALVADAGPLAVRYASELTKFLETVEDQPDLVTAMTTRVDRIRRHVAFAERRGAE